MIGLSPGTHHIRVIGSDAGDDVDSLLLQLGQIGDIAREMLARATGGECTGNSKENYFLSGELCDKSLVTSNKNVAFP